MRRPVRSILVLIPTLAALGLLTAAASDQDAVYRARFDAMMKAGGVVTHYDPMEVVPGARSAVPLRVATAAERSIRGDALDRATAYAGANNSSALIVWRNGTVQRETYFGAANRATQIVSKSLSKPLGAIAVGRAIALGRIKSLDQPVADFIPEWTSTPKAAILVRHLLDMRSGMLGQMTSPDPAHPINRAYLGPDHDRVLIHDYPLVDVPGTRFGYSNAVADMIALLIERATGMRYAEFIGREVLTPIGAPGGRIWVDRPGGLAHSGCCMTLPAESWLRLGVLLLDDGMAGRRRLLPRGYVTQMTTPTPQNPYYGLGVWVAGRYVKRRGFTGVDGPGPQVLHGAPYADRTLFLFDGNANQVVYISPATRMVIVRVGDAPPRQPTEWDNSVLPNLLIDGIVPRKGERKPVPQPEPAV